MILLQVLAGVIYSLSFKPIGIWFLAPVAIALQIFLLRRYRLPEFQSFLFAFSSSLIILSWSKTFVGALPWIALALLQGVLAIPLGIVARFTKDIAPLFFVLLLLEEIRARFPFGGFSWTRIAFSQVDSPFSPLVAIVGVIGLSLITLLITRLILYPQWTSALLFIPLLISSALVTEPQSKDETLRVRAVQGGVPERGLEFNKRAQEVLDNHIRRTMSDVKNGDQLILWPENAIDIDPRTNRQVKEKLIALNQETDKPLIAGAILDDDKLFNSTVLVDVDGAITSTYIKRYLTPFGEYIPLRGIASLFSPHTDRVTDFSPGKELVTHSVANAEIASVICYELLNDGIVREAAKSSDFLVVHTNSATFSGSSEGEQQLAITRLRALESQKSIVSISTTGPSAIIDAQGRVLQKLEDGEVGSFAASVPLQGSDSFVHRMGGFSTAVVLLFTLMWALLTQRNTIARVWRKVRR